MPQGDSTSTHSSVIRLPDGRALSYAQYGDPAGRVVFYFHGHPGSRLEARLLAEPAAVHGVRLIGVDRPGLGLSAYQPRRRMLDWPHDISVLGDRLGIDTFAVAGLSAGGPYALACAHAVPERLTACGVISGVGGVGQFASFLSLWLPWLLTPLARRRFRDEEHAGQSLERFARRWVESDRSCLQRADVRDALIDSLTEAFRQGSRAAARDGVLLAGRPWGFRLADIAFAPVMLFHGARDTSVPIAAARTVARALPRCEPHYYGDDGHLSVIVNRGTEIVAALRR